MRGRSGNASSLQIDYGRFRRAGFRVAFVVSALLVSTVIGATGQASALTIYGPSACLNGDTGPRELVASSNGPSFSTNVTLYCGDPTKGVIHINSDHPIRDDGTDDHNVQRCHDNIMYYGEEVPAVTGNRAWQIARPTGGTATIVFDENTFETISMFTSDSNNWAACAAYPD